METAVARRDGHRQFGVFEVLGEGSAPVGLHQVPQGHVHSLADRFDGRVNVPEPLKQGTHGVLAEESIGRLLELRDYHSDYKAPHAVRKVASIFAILSLGSSCPGSAWARTVREAPPRALHPRPHQWLGRKSLGTRGLNGRRWIFSPRPRFGGEGSWGRLPAGQALASRLEVGPTTSRPRSGGEGRKKSTGGTLCSWLAGQPTIREAKTPGGRG